MTLSDYVHSLTDNPYFGAGFGLFGVGASAAVLRKALQGAVVVLRRKYLITLEVPCRDKSYQWLLQWITEKGAKTTQHLSVETSFEQKDTGLIKTKYDFIPSIGTHFFRSVICLSLYPVRGSEWSGLGGSHGCPGRIWARFL